MANTQNPFGQYGNLWDLVNQGPGGRYGTADGQIPKGLPDWLSSQFTTQQFNTGGDGGQDYTALTLPGAGGGAMVRNQAGQEVVQVGDPTKYQGNNGQFFKDPKLVTYDPALGYVTPPDNLGKTLPPWSRTGLPMLLAVMGGGAALTAAGVGAGVGATEASGTGAFDVGGSTGFGGSTALDTGAAGVGTGAESGYGLTVPGPLSPSTAGEVGGLSSVPDVGGGSGIGSTLSNINRVRQGLGILNSLGSGGSASRPNGGSEMANFDISSLLSLIALGRQGGLGGSGVGTPSGAQNVANQAADRADPWGTSGRRGQFIDQLTPDAVNKLLNPNPQDIANDPAYQFQLSQGIRAINQGDAAQGTLRSGNRLTELQQYGQGLASTFEQSQFQENMQRLQAMGGLAGVNSGSPVASGNDLISGFEGATSLQNNGLSNLLGNLLSGGSGASALNGMGNSLISLLANGGKGISDWISGVFNNGMSDQDISNLIAGHGGGDISDTLFPGGGDGSSIFDALAGP